MNGTKSELIAVQKKMIDHKISIVKFREDVIEEIQNTVISSVGETVKSELQTYSDVVTKSGSTVTGSVLDQTTIKAVVKDAVAEGDRNRNVMIFGLTEDKDEKLCDKVSNLFLELGEKPKIEAGRVGKKSSSSGDNDKKPVRPVKVHFSNATIVHQILNKARHLRNSEHYNKVFISPDRSVEERARQKELITELKKRTKDEPDIKHFIRGGRVCSVEKL